MMRGIILKDRSLLRLSGADVRDFLQGLISMDISGADDGVIYAALLSPQGKYLFDFFVLRDGADYLIDVKSERAPALAQRLTLYKLRADVTISSADMTVAQILENAPEAAFKDPRNPALGNRLYTEQAPDLTEVPHAEFEHLRISHAIPETGLELIPEETFILEAGFEELSGVDFRKGCYVGQEVTARMKHKTELRKGLAKVAISGTAPAPGTPITAGDKPAGTLFSSSGDIGLAHLRFDRAKGEMQAGEATLKLYDVPSG